jgi:hypothetical protein
MPIFQKFLLPPSSGIGLDNGCSMHLSNNSKLPLDYTVEHPRRQPSST